MHWTLNPRRSATGAAAWAVLAVVFAWFTRPVPLVQIAMGLVAGVGVGLLQRRSLAQAPSAYRAANTAMLVRKAMTSTRSGKYALAIQWGSAVVIFVVTIVLLQWNPPGARDGYGLLCGYAVLIAARELTALPGLRALASGGASERHAGLDTVL